MRNIYKELVHKARLDDLILVYSMGKVGSSTAFETLKPFFAQNRIFHIHFLSDYWLNEILPTTNHSDNINYGKKIRKIVEAHRGPKKIITSCREPVSREISNFFENPNDYLSNSIESYELDELLSIFQEKVSFDYCLSWFDSELQNYTGVNVFSYFFDQGNGYSVIKELGWEIHLFKLEGIQSALPIMSKALGVSKALMVNANRTREKSQYMITAYDYFREHYKLSSEMAEKIYSSTYCKHFYSPNELDQFKRRWS